MPNWCRGTLIVRGTKENIKKFLLGNLSADDLEIQEDDKKITICSQEPIFIEETSCDFIADDIVFNFEPKETINQCTMNQFMAANYIKPEPYIQMSRKYDIDIDIGGIEVYGGFAQDIKIQKGEIIIDKVEEINLDFRAEDEEFIDEDSSVVDIVYSSVKDDQDKYEDLPF